MTIQRHSITFIKQENDIMQPITKFGGKPFWLTNAQWPLSKSLNKPMKFIAQIDLNDTPLKKDDGIQTMIYLFITDHDDVCDQWDPNSGENAVIIQSSDAKTYHPDVSVLDSISDELIVENLLYNMEEATIEGKRRNVPVPVIFTCHLDKTTDPVLLCDDDILDSEMEEKYVEAVQGDKFGGTPYFIQNIEYPENDPDNWSLLLQIEDRCEFFELNFGMGIGFLFINKDLDAGKFLFQC